jgi:hypothetical protein
VPHLLFNFATTSLLSTLARLSGRLKNTFVYVDGFNLYYGAVKGTPYKWLDIHRLCQLLLPKNRILKLKYFTALMLARSGDPDPPTIGPCGAG